MKKSICGILSVAALVLQAEVALAGCPSSEVVGTWKLAGSNMAGGNTAALWCPALTLSSAGGNRYNLRGACKTQRPPAAAASYTVSGEGTVIVSAMCKLAGNFLLFQGSNSETVTFLDAQFQNAGAVGNKTQAQGIVRTGSTGISFFSMIR
jgi:hypothetical protein